MPESFLGRVKPFRHVILFFSIVAFWAIITKLHTRVPVYAANEANVLESTTFENVLTFRDYGGYYRFSPTGLILTSVVDKAVIKPLSKDKTPELEEPSKRLIPVYILAFGLIAVLILFVSEPFIGTAGGILSAVFLSTNFNLYYFFTFASCVTGCLLIVYTLGLVHNLLKWLKENKSKKNLIGFYVFFFLLVGAWEQWVNVLPFLFATAALSYYSTKNKKVFIHFVLVPFIVFVLYAVARAPFTQKEMMAVREAQFVFSYPSKALMLEEMVTNMSYHISNTIESAFFPWPSLSVASLRGFNMSEFNPYNPTYTTNPNVHYLGLGLWYAGILFAIFCYITISHFLKIAKKLTPILSLGTIGLLLTWAGFAAHVPLMHRTYFLMPGYLLGFKHSISIVGFSLFIGWWFTTNLVKEREGRKIWIYVVIGCGWILMNNYFKISSNLILGFK